MIKTETRCGAEVAFCESCGCFCSASGGSLRHAAYCAGGKRSERYAPPVVNPVTVEQVAAIGISVPLNAVGNGAAEDKFHTVNSRNPKDWDRAMNRDD